MQAATMPELRELSRRSRRAQRRGFGTMLAMLALFPAQIVLGRWFPAQWVALAGMAVAGALFVAYAFAAGQERGAFRKVFRRMSDERRMRTIIPDEPAPAPALRVEVK